MVASAMNNLTDVEIESGSDESIPQFRVFWRGEARFALMVDDILSVGEWRRPTPLPHAPPAVLGVVSIQGRMLTVLDPVLLLSGPNSENGDQGLIVALRGDEQLALLVDSASENVTADICAADSLAQEGALGVIKHEGDAITVIDVKRLFPMAIRGRERRKRGFQQFQ
jgi:chemotaxis signal transduction protein